MIDPSSRLVYSYHSAMEGFAAQLSESELESLKMLPDVVAIRPDRIYQVQTTYSYKFLGLDPASKEGAWHKSSFGRGTIIGVLDTGVWPESPSFNDHGMPRVPKKWRGICQQGQDFNSSNCNRKLIGARFFTRGYRVGSMSNAPGVVQEYASPRDSHGHGTHTSSTAGGASVGMASVLGNAAGVARGMAPGAHVAVYKVCWLNGCYSSDILAAMDVAIIDGVDILSLSLGGFPTPLFADSIAIGSFRAVEHGISVVCAAGNNGPIESSVANEAPWIATIGASTLDRRFPAIVQMGNGKVLYGQSMYPGNRLMRGTGKESEVVYVTDENTGSEFCFKGSLPREKVRGKIVVCDRGINGRAEKGEVVKEAGGAGMILANTEINLEEDSVDVHVLPATLIGFDESIHLKAYINSTRRPTARIVYGGTVIGKSRAPAVAQFSARGPSLSNPSILKPDVIAPGVNIIAAWPQNIGPTYLPEDSRRVNFTIMSGTSMACPHASGIAALVRSVHPKWSPAAIKSAIMTTADVTDRSAFDSMLAGCIPVFFHPGSAYAQYTWHLPRDYTTYSVFIPENDIRKNISIEERLSQIPPEKVIAMREEVINLIPRLVYADPRSKLETFKDAFDVSVQAIIDKVTQARRDMVEGRTDDNFIEEISWKYALLEKGQRTVGPHEWDRSSTVTPVLAR